MRPTRRKPGASSRGAGAAAAGHSVHSTVESYMIDAVSTGRLTSLIQQYATANNIHLRQ